MLNTEGSESNETEKSLKPRYPDCFNGFERLSNYHVQQITKRVLHYMRRLCNDRGAAIDYEYWYERTVDILTVRSREKALIIPARAGSGKSTWMLAFILALCEMYIAEEPLVKYLGGVMIVVQKVETLNELLEQIETFFPDKSTELMIALQGWSKSGQDYEFCQNKQVNSYQECMKSTCPYADTCPILSFMQNASNGFILGMTQKRFSILRKDRKLEEFLHSTSCSCDDRLIPRRFLIFDEKFDMVEEYKLSVPLINEASTSVEELAKKRNCQDKEVRSIQTGLSMHVQSPFQDLRRHLTYEYEGNEIDYTFGFCSFDISNLERKTKYQEFRNSFYGYRKKFLTPEIKNCLAVMDQLYEKECLFIKSNGFSVICNEPIDILFGNAQTIVFDATAEVDGDYRNLQQVRFLKTSPALHMKQVKFHIYEHPDLNVSKSAMVKSWKPPAFASLVDELIEPWEGDVFLCTYKEYAEYFPKYMSEEVNKRLVKMPGREDICVPYFGGTNGANNFNQCTNVIMLGYPRFSPGDYLQRAYAYWDEVDVKREILNFTDELEYKPWGEKDSFRKIPLLDEYQSMHLAARLEQEIYRSALRNNDCEKTINVVLFSPPDKTCQILLDRFDGCTVQCYEDLPECVASHRNRNRSYGKKPTAYSKLDTFFREWDGDPIKSSDLRDKLDISVSAWKDLMKQDKSSKLLENHKVVRTGRGPNAKFCREKKACA